MLEKNGKIYKHLLYDNTHLFKRGLMDVQIEGWNPDIPMNYDDIICIRTSGVEQTSIPILPKALRELEISYSKLTTVPVFPTGIQKIVLIHNNIEITDEKWSELRAMHPRAFIQIENPDHSMFRGKPVLEEHHLQNAREEIHMIRQDRRGINVLDSDQTVHITSINHGVSRAMDIIRTEVSRTPLVVNPIEKLFVSSGWIHDIKGLFCGKPALYKHITQWCNDRMVHTLHKITFSELFRMVMTIAENHPQKADLKERIRTELSESINLCFTGRINRLVNALVGFLDGIVVGLTVRETTQMRIQGLIQRLMNKKINVNQAKEEMTRIFAEVGEDDGLTDEFKNANLLALDDFEDDLDDETDPLLDL